MVNLNYRNGEKKMINRKEEKKKYYIFNRNKYLKKAKEYRKINREKIRIHQREYYKKNKQKLLAHQKEYRIKNPEKYRLSIRKSMEKKPEYYKQLNKTLGKKHRDECKRKVIEYYSKEKFCCDCCGEKEYDFLTIDHINNDGGKHRRAIGLGSSAGYRFYIWLIKNNFPKGYQVLCMNCNFSKGKNGRCVHNAK